MPNLGKLKEELQNRKASWHLGHLKKVLTFYM